MTGLFDDVPDSPPLVNVPGYSDTTTVVHGKKGLFDDVPEEQNEYGVSGDVASSIASQGLGNRDAATLFAKSQSDSGLPISATQAVLPSLFNASTNGEGTGSRLSSLAGDITGLPFRTVGSMILGAGSGIAGAVSHARDNVAQHIDPMVGMIPAALGPAAARFQSEMAQPTGITGSPSSLLMLAPYMDAPAILGKGAALLAKYPAIADILSGGQKAAQGFKGAHPVLNAMGTGAAYGGALDVAANGLNSLGGTSAPSIAIPKAVSDVAMAVPQTRNAILQSLYAGNGGGTPTRSLGEALASPVAAAGVSALGSGLAEMGLNAIPGVGAMVDQSVKYALKGKRAAGGEMAGRLGELIDAANGPSGLGALHGIGSIESVADRARASAGRGYDAVGTAIAPNTAAMAPRQIVTDITSPLYGHPIPDPAIFGERLGWVAPPGKEAELGNALSTIRNGQSEYPGAIPEGSWLDVGNGIPASLNDLYQEARSNMFRKMASGDPAYASVTRAQAESALDQKFRSAHGLQMEPKLYQGPVPSGEALPTMYWPDLSALRVPANVRQGSSLRANGAAFQNSIRNELGDVVTKYMYGNNAAVDRSGMRGVLNAAGKDYKFAKLGEQLAIQDATKRVGQENPLITALRPFPERIRYSVPMLARYLGTRMQTQAAPIISGSTNGGIDSPLLSGPMP